MKTAIRTIIIILIVLFAFASMVNIHARTGQLHADAGWHSWIISGGIATVFALFALALVISKGKVAKAFFSFCTVFGAILTSTLQIGMYQQLGADTQTALAFGAGVPMLEALLAISEHFLTSKIEATNRRSEPSAWGIVGNAFANRIAVQLQPKEPLQPALPSQNTEMQPQLPEVQPAKPVAITPLAMEALRMQQEEMTIADIAAKLQKSERTISNYLKAAKSGEAIGAYLNGRSKQ